MCKIKNGKKEKSYLLLIFLMGKHKCPPFQTTCQTFCLHGSLNLGQVKHAFHKPIIIALVLNDNTVT